MNYMGSMIDSLGIWNWWILAGIMLVLELLAPTFFFLWLGAAALSVGLIMLFADWGWQIQVTVFAVLSIVYLVLSRLLIRRDRSEQEDSLLNRRGHQLVGDTYVIDDGISNGRGRVRIADSVWLVRGPDCDAGSRIRITGVEGATLIVEPAEAVSGS